MTTKTEEINKAILNERMKKFNDRTPDKPKVGEFVRFPDGSYSRITYYWILSGHADLVQCGGGSSSFYLSENGFLDYSGGLDSPFPAHKLVLVKDKQKRDWLWFFSENYRRANNGAHFKANFRVWEFIIIDYDVFIRQYIPITNTNASINDPWDATLFVAFGEDLKVVQNVRKATPQNVWTVIQAEGKTYAQAGYHLVNRYGYFITEKAWTNKDLQVKLK